MNTSPQLLVTAVKMVAALGIVLLGMLLVYYLTRRLTNIGGRTPKSNLIRVLSNHYLGMKKSICLVQVPGAVLVVGISSDAMRLLTKIEDPAVLEKLHPEPASALAPNFSDYLQKLLQRVKPSPKNPE
jgi:flagellar biogenesis protein FliO